MMEGGGGGGYKLPIINDPIFDRCMKKVMSGVPMKAVELTAKNFRDKFIDFQKLN